MPEPAGHRQRPDRESKSRWRRLLAHIHREEVEPLIVPGTADPAELQVAGEKLARAAQLLKLAEADLALDDIRGAVEFERLARDMAESGLTTVDRHLVDTGVAEVIGRHRVVIASELEVDDLPEADLTALGKCGIADPWAEAQLAILRLRAHTEGRYPIEPVHYDKAVKTTLSALAGEDEASDIHKPAMRRWFKGVGAVVKGGVLIAVDGGLLIAGAPITAAEPTTSAALLGSMAIGFNDVASGIGDLRGE